MSEEHTFQLVLNTYRAILDDLKFMKQQQWMIANYSVLIIAGLFAFSHSEAGKAISRSLVGMLAALAGVYASVLIGIVQNDVFKARVRVDLLLKRNFDREQLLKIALSDPQISELKSETGGLKQAIRGSEFLIAGPIAVCWVAVLLVICSL